MFDDQQKNLGSVPGNLPTEPEDMFSGLSQEQEDDFEQQPKSANDALSAGRLRPKEPVMQVMPSDMGSQTQPLNQVSAYKVKGPVLGKILFVVLLLAIIVLVVVGVWWLYTKFFQKSGVIKILNQVGQTTSSAVQTDTTNSQAKTVSASNTVSSSVSSSTSDIKGQINNDNILFGEAVDTDKDGLDDIREGLLKTNPNNSDTDNDELSDGDEVLIWKTNPLNPDSDGDSYPDGREIRYGYNPLGPGKLFNLSTSTAASGSTTTVK